MLWKLGLVIVQFIADKYSKGADFAAWSCGTLLSTPPQSATTPHKKVWALRLADKQLESYDQVQSIYTNKSKAYNKAGVDSSVYVYISLRWQLQQNTNPAVSINVHSYTF